MAGMGPAPNPNSRRRNATLPMTLLPAAGRPGDAPRWPLLDDVALTARRDAARRQADELELQLTEPELTGRRRTALQKKADAAVTEANILTKKVEAQSAVEAELWAELWRLPQAVMWERHGWIREVAQYVRWKVAAELGDLDASKESRMLADRLGLNPLAMLRLRWEVSSDEVAEARAARPARRAGDVRSRLRAVGDE
ncbi:hypothetical protein ACFQ60_22460 [Streptomyces zhihengii]|uniref:Uncharacterized protein n=1 Tax=Streptomyces zhihengii TaxID=1818004 RepID=A0ABS2UVD1_9ACTN|nr:hypothetical protein [Streptomyces zhihengii]MBM9621018.1 hypothetical protein [Streptomyces zhihengii]